MRRAAGLLCAFLAGCGADYDDAALPPQSQPSPTVTPHHDGWPADRWVARLADPDPAARVDALGALATLGLVAAPHAAVVAARLEDADANVRWAAAEALGRLGEAASPHAQALVARLDDPSLGVARAAATAAGRLDAVCVPALVARLVRAEDPARDLVRRALTDVGPAAAAGVEGLAAGLASEDPTVVEDVVAVLAATGDPGGAALARALSDPRAWAATLAAEALGRMGEAGRGGIDALAAALGRTGNLRRAAADALVALGEPARPALERAAGSADAEVAATAAEALAELDRRRAR